MKKLCIILFMVAELSFIGLLFMSKEALADWLCRVVEPTHKYRIIVDRNTLPEGIRVETESINPHQGGATGDIGLINTTSIPLIVEDIYSYKIKQIKDQQFFAPKGQNYWKPNTMPVNENYVTIAQKPIPFIGLWDKLILAPRDLVAIEGEKIIAVPDKPFSFPITFGDQQYVIRGKVEFIENKDFNLKSYLTSDVPKIISRGYKELGNYTCRRVIDYRQLNDINLER